MSGGWSNLSCHLFSCICDSEAKRKMANDQVPVLKIPRDERINFIESVFFHEYDSRPEFLVKVPGRVNIIGEHIDYCGFPVLPMALEQDIVIAIKIIKQKELHIKNVNEKHLGYYCLMGNSDEIEIESDANGKPFWYNYILCGIKGAMEDVDNEFQHGLQLLVDGTIPPASGLSSSSALVSAACLGFLYAQKSKNLLKKSVATLCAVCERYIGTQGGGMDQAIAFLAEKNCAQYISFLPLQTTPIYLPDNAAFVVANSMTEANKAANNEFNTRVIECRLAAKIIADLEEVETGSKNMITLGELRDCRDSTFEEMIKLVNKHLPQESYSKSEVCSLLNTTEEILDEYLTPDTRDLANLKLRQRALHVYEEARRVEKFKELCIDSSSAKRPNDNIISQLGNLMTESHESLKNLYECSHENLDLLVNLSKEFGVSARLTGAGWGGCIVAICREEQVNAYIDYLTEEFYVKHCKVDKESVQSFIFSTGPNDGAVIYQNNCSMFCS